jgi:hypothetical protein
MLFRHQNKGTHNMCRPVYFICVVQHDCWMTLFLPILFSVTSVQCLVSKNMLCIWPGFPWLWFCLAGYVSPVVSLTWHQRKGLVIKGWGLGLRVWACASARVFETRQTGPGANISREREAQVCVGEVVMMEMIGCWGCGYGCVNDRWQGGYQVFCWRFHTENDMAAYTNSMCMCG